MFLVFQTMFRLFAFYAATFFLISYTDVWYLGFHVFLFVLRWQITCCMIGNALVQFMYACVSAVSETPPLTTPKHSVWGYLFPCFLTSTEYCYT